MTDRFFKVKQIFYTKRLVNWKSWLKELYTIKLISKCVHRVRMHANCSKFLYQTLRVKCCANKVTSWLQAFSHIYKKLTESGFIFKQIVHGHLTADHIKFDFLIKKTQHWPFRAANIIYHKYSRRSKSLILFKSSLSAFYWFLCKIYPNIMT